jgi:SsrA-binding protein
MKARVDQEHLTLVPLSLYFKDGRAKLELGMGKGRKHYDKRQVIAQRDSDMDAKRAMAARRRDEG